MNLVSHFFRRRRDRGRRGFVGPVDPGCLRGPGDLGWTTDEPLRVSGVGEVERHLAGRENLLGPPAMDGLGG